MGELILCEQPIAATPYYIDELSLNIYSLEELSYYIFHNVYLMNSELMSVDLCQWIGRDLKMKELKEHLLELLKDNVPSHIFIGNLLQACGYLTNKEIRDTVEIIKTYENKSEAECHKIRADRLMEKNKIIDAIYEYENILSNDENMTEALAGDVWHNLGTAYANLFFYEESARCFENAYLKSHKRISLRSLLFAYRCNRDVDGFQKACKRFFLTEEQAKEIGEEVTKISQAEDVLSFDNYLDQLRADYADETLYLNQLTTIVEQLKDDYNHICRI